VHPMKKEPTNPFRRLIFRKVRLLQLHLQAISQIESARETAGLRVLCSTFKGVIPIPSMALLGSPRGRLKDGAGRVLLPYESLEIVTALVMAQKKDIGSCA